MAKIGVCNCKHVLLLLKDIFCCLNSKWPCLKRHKHCQGLNNFLPFQFLPELEYLANTTLFQLFCNIKIRWPPPHTRRLFFNRVKFLNEEKPNWFLHLVITKPQLNFVSETWIWPDLIFSTFNSITSCLMDDEHSTLSLALQLLKQKVLTSNAKLN